MPADTYKHVLNLFVETISKPISDCTSWIRFYCLLWEQFSVFKVIWKGRAAHYLSYSWICLYVFLCWLLEFLFVDFSFASLGFCCWLNPKWPALSFCIIDTSIFFFVFVFFRCGYCVHFTVLLPLSNTSNSSNFTWSDHFDLCHEKFKMSLSTMKVLHAQNTLRALHSNDSNCKREKKSRTASTTIHWQYKAREHWHTHTHTNRKKIV